MKCAKNHAMQDGQKFCGECGGEAVAEMRKCHACEGTFQKAYNFCPGCGQAAGEIVVDLEAIVGELDTFAKARAAVFADLATLPEVPDATVTKERLGQIMKAAMVPETDTEPQHLDAELVLEELLKESGKTGQAVATYTGHMLKAITRLAADNEQLLKSHIAIMGAMKILADRVEGLANNPRNGGRKAVTRIEAFRKSHTAGAPNEGEDVDHGFGEAGKIKGPDLMAKAILATRRGFMKALTVSNLETFTNNGHSLHEIATVDAELAAQVYAGISTLAAAPAEATQH